MLTSTAPGPAALALARSIVREMDDQRDALIRAAGLPALATLDRERWLSFVDPDGATRRARFVDIAAWVEGPRHRRRRRFAVTVQHVGGAESTYRVELLRDVRPAGPLPEPCGAFRVDPATATRKAPRCATCGMTARVH